MDFCSKFCAKRWLPRDWFDHEPVSSVETPTTMQNTKISAPLRAPAPSPAPAPAPVTSVPALPVMQQPMSVSLPPTKRKSVKLTSETMGDNSKDTIGAELARYRCKALSLEDFEVLKVLGTGTFGKVKLVKLKSDPKGSGRLYAMKSVHKDAVIKTGQIEHIRTERFIYENISHPFLTHLEFAFQTPAKL